MRLSCNTCNGEIFVVLQAVAMKKRQTEDDVEIKHFLAHAIYMIGRAESIAVLGSECVRWPETKNAVVSDLID